MLVPFPIAFFAATLVCDLVYRQSLNEFWFIATQYLLGAGIVMALLAAVMGFADFFSDARIRAIPVAWFHMLGNLVMVLASPRTGICVTHGDPKRFCPQDWCCHWRPC